MERPTRFMTTTALIVALGGPWETDTRTPPGAIPAPVKKRYLKLNGKPFASCEDCHKDEHKKQLDQDCSKCHNIKEWKDITRFDHDRDSVYALTWKHMEVKCAKCHAQNKWKPIEHKKCDSCHKDVHKAQFKGQLCDACHSTKDWKADRFKHVPPEYKGYALTGKHLTTPCDKCHVKGAYKPIKSATCDGPGCHPNPHKKQFEGKKCDACHITAGWGKDAFDHNDPSYKGYKLEGKHLKVSVLIAPHIPIIPWSDWYHRISDCIGH